MGKHKHLKFMGFLNISDEAEIHTIHKKMGKVNSHSKGKIRENTNISNLRVSGIFCLKQKSMQFPKYGKSGLPLYRKSMGKNPKHSEVMGFSTFWVKQKSIQFPKYGKSEFP